MFDDENVKTLNKIITGLKNQEDFRFVFSPVTDAAPVREFINQGRRAFEGKPYAKLQEIDQGCPRFEPDDMAFIIDSGPHDHDTTPGSSLSEIIQIHTQRISGLLKEYGIENHVLPHPSVIGGPMVVIPNHQLGIKAKLEALLKEKAQTSPVINSAGQAMKAIDAMIFDFPNSSREDNLAALQMLAQKTAEAMKASELRPEVRARIMAESGLEAKPERTAGGGGGWPGNL